MLPQRPHKQEIPLSEEAIFNHKAWFEHPYTQRVLALLNNENSDRIVELLDSFHNLSEAQVKSCLQQIKTQRNIITCLNKPLQK